MKVLFFALKSRLLKNGEAPIILRVTIDGQSEDARIQRSVPLKMWNNVKGCSKGKDRASVELNCYIESLTVRLYQIHKELLCQEALVIPKHLLVKLFSKEERRIVLGTMKKYMDDWTALIGKEYQKSTLSRYGNCYELLEIVTHYSLNIFSEIPFYRFSLYIRYLQIFSFGLNTHEISRF